MSRNTGDAGLEQQVDAAEPASPDHARVRSALAELGPDQRRVLELAYFEGLSCSEIAERIAIPVGTVKSRIAAGLDRLRSGLVDAGARAVRTDQAARGARADRTEKL